MPLSRVAEWYVLADLQALCKESDLTYTQIGDELGVSARTIQNYVSGETRPKAGMAAKFAEVCGASKKRIDFLIHVISQLDSGMIVSDLNKRNILILEHGEAASGEIWKFETGYVPGPFQTERYHMELLTEPTKNRSRNWHRKHRRFSIISRRDPAPVVNVLMGINVLRQIRDWDGAEDQFNHLLEIDQWPNCEIRLLDGFHYGSEHPFEIYLPGGRPKAPPPFVYVESIDQSRHIEDAEKFGLYHGRVKDMWSSGNRIGGSLDDWIR
ncbi:Scr1 family TA system antitoxin-like transcriptional regulator [Glycomyces paridis]|uniref:Helix-turn-helix transcriptional regulator n=1 Tax=Glycomyces paridis TaxID=2126555 RepID=A0A4S8P439_9ACTN|nr:Scr1 family TA system antitoxin-like transcriptional regulator [Glycomyces paridis]THV23602.1 helix-turn-helix transcriptional regulator [Glycomyces paridis]